MPISFQEAIQRSGDNPSDWTVEVEGRDVSNQVTRIELIEEVNNPVEFNFVLQGLDLDADSDVLTGNEAAILYKGVPAALGLIENVKSNSGGETEVIAQGFSARLNARVQGTFTDTNTDNIVETVMDQTQIINGDTITVDQNERLNKFASVLSHDLRNPLSVASGRLELAQSESDSTHLDAVSQAHTRMETLIDDLLTLAREGNSVGELESVRLESLAEGCWRNVDTEEATIQIEADRMIRADRSRLQQLLENLFRNTVEHSSSNVSITVGVSDRGFYIEDDGPGIPPEERDRVFDIGYSTADEGTGFGLAIVRRIAEAHGWNVSVVEGSTGGARFEIAGVDTVSG